MVAIPSRSRNCNLFKAIPMPKFRGITIQYKKCSSERKEIIRSVAMHPDNTAEHPTTQSNTNRESSNNKNTIFISQQNLEALLKLSNDYKNPPNKCNTKQNATSFVTQVRNLRSNSEINRIFKSRYAMAHSLTSIESHAQRLCIIIDELNKTILEKQSQTTTNPTTTISSDTNSKNQVQHSPAQAPSIQQQSRVWGSNSQGHSEQNTQNEAETQNSSTNSSEIPQTTKHHDNPLQTDPQKPHDEKNLPFEPKSISDCSGEANATPPTPRFSSRPTSIIHLLDAIEPTQPLQSTQYKDYTTSASMLSSKFYWINNPNYNGPNNTTPDPSNMAEDVVEKTINPLITETLSTVADKAIEEAAELASTVSNGMQALSNGLDDLWNRFLGNN